MNRFDQLQEKAQRVVTRTMGYSAIWIPLVGGPAFTAEVLFNQPTQKEDVSDEHYIIQRPRMEYFEGDFPGLFESVEDKNNEVVTVNNQQFIAFLAEKKYDGKTIILHLEPKP